ncbi:MAG: DEAD/DEAH box helicase [Desulfovibrio sp.]|nr:DEAD/DEAH box helicase [Desulfovibrio sp.]
MGVFDRYAPAAREYIYRNNWEELRAIQVAAGDVIFNSDENALLTASTAAGKTEAAFFPIITLLTENPPSSIGCLYIGPLKALINDQFLRLYDLCDETDIPVWRWHGDVAQNRKHKLMKKPSGILQITPESLEAILLHKHSAIPKMFGDLRFIVIDEIHSLLRGDRGGQTLCLIERLGKLAGVNPRRIGLSATIGDPEKTGELLSMGTGRRTIIPKIKAPGMKWRLSMEHFYIDPPKTGEEPNPSPPADSGDMEKTDHAPENADPGLGYIFEHTRGKKCLVFSNSREECEAVTSTLREYCERRGEPDRFLIHHGNLSASYRETAEEAMKDDNICLTTVTTSTLELGIDIGRLERAFQIDAPWTVSSFLQRMGRTGRRGQPPEMRFVMREDAPEPRALFAETIPWKLLQGIAIVQLYMEDRWVEPPRLERLPYSLLYHQTMATLASSGEISPRALAERVLGLSYFRGISQDDYKTLLRHLLEMDHIQRTEKGGLIVGLGGEKIINSYKFYGVFKENEEYTVRDETREMGTIVSPPPIGEKIAIAGHVWIVLDVDHKRHTVYCEQVKGTIPAYFGLCAGDIHTRILERMAGVLREEKTYPYLLKNAVVRLEQSRKEARMAGLDRNVLINVGGNVWHFFPWLGTYPFVTLERILKIKCKERLDLRNFDSARPFYLQFNMDADAKDFFRVLKEELAKPIDPLELIYPKELPLFDKYDEFLPPELVVKGFARGVLDIDAVRNASEKWSQGLN